MDAIKALLLYLEDASYQHMSATKIGQQKQLEVQNLFANLWEFTQAEKIGKVNCGEGNEVI